MCQLSKSKYLIGLFFALLGAGIVVHGQSQDPGTSSSALETTGVAASTDYYDESTSLANSTPDLTSEAEKERSKLADCHTSTDLKTYCSNIMTPKEMGFFQNDTSIMGVLAKMLTPGITYALQEQCQPGKWCLPDSYRKSISDGMSYFYSTPICQSDNLWTCLETIEITRRQCNESDLYFLMSSIGMMCDINAIEGGYITNKCYTRSIEALHVVHSDNSRNIQEKDKKDMCSDYNKQMTNTYGCAATACDMEQRVFLEDFEPWAFISSRAEDVLETCNMNLQCQGGYPTQNAPTPGKPGSASQTPGSTSELGKVLGSTESPEQEVIEEIEAVIAAEEAIEKITDYLYYTTTDYYHMPPTKATNAGEQVVDGQGMDIPESDGDVDQTFVYGMVTVTAVVIISFTLMGVIAFKRFSRIRKNYKLGYSQMTEEESRMLKNEYN